MKNEEINKQHLQIAKKKLQKLKIFYMHCAAYIVLLGLVIWNFLVIEDGEYKETIIWLNFTSIVVWGLFLCIHGYITFKGKFIFTKQWEDRKIKEYMEDEKTDLWE